MDKNMNNNRRIVPKYTLFIRIKHCLQHGQKYRYTIKFYIKDVQQCCFTKSTRRLNSLGGPATIMKKQQDFFSHIHCTITFIQLLKNGPKDNLSIHIQNNASHRFGCCTEAVKIAVKISYSNIVQMQDLIRLLACLRIYSMYAFRL